MGGLSPLSFAEIKAYMDSTETPLSPKEVLIIKQMSVSYCNYVNDKNPNTPSPYIKK